MKLTIRNKLLGGFSLILILLVISNFVSNNRISFTDENYKELINENVYNSMMAKDLEIYYFNQASSVRSFLITNDESYITEYEENLEKAKSTLDRMLEAYEDDQDKVTIQQLAAFQIRYDEIVRKELALKKDGNEIGYKNLMNTSGKTISNVFREKLEHLNKGQEQLVLDGSKETSDSVEKTKDFVLYLGVASILIGILLAIFISQTITRPVKLAADAIHKVSMGELDIEILKVKNKDEVGDLIDSFNHMVKDLREVVGQVQVSSSSVASSSEELVASAEQSTLASEQISRMTQESVVGTERQLSQYKDLSDSIGEMNDGIQQIAVNSEEMLQLSERTTSLTIEGAKIVDHVVGQMNQIQGTMTKASSSILSLKERSNEISQIIGIITGVADQTNLLALNAAIEAARAGEHGKGFAVVANEVRKLAEESKRSARQITEMIGLIQTETNHSVQMMEEEDLLVKEGLEETENAHQVFLSISSAMGEVTDKVEDVSSSIEEMMAVSNQILAAVSTVKEIAEKSTENSQETAAATQQQFASMEEVAASAQFLSNMAEDLQNIISKFRL